MHAMQLDFTTTRNNQNKAVLEYLNKHGSINAIEAEDMGIMRLSARIFDLHQQGYAFNRKMNSVRGRHGFTKVCEYSLKWESSF